MPIILLIIFILTILLVVLAMRFQRKRFRQMLKDKAFNPAWVLILQKNMALYHKLPDELKSRLHGLINVFLHEKTFSGYNGLQINDRLELPLLLRLVFCCLIAMMIFIQL